MVAAAVSGDGFLIIGDSAGLLNGQRLKGIHLGMKSGMLAAETILEALAAGGATAERLARFEEKVEASWIKEEIWPVRNFHQAFDHGLFAGMFQAGVGAGDRRAAAGGSSTGWRPSRATSG